jgi:hypothetical protein
MQCCEHPPRNFCNIWNLVLGGSAAEDEVPSIDDNLYLFFCLLLLAWDCVLVA